MDHIDHKLFLSSEGSVPWLWPSYMVTFIPAKGLEIVKVVEAKNRRDWKKRARNAELQLFILVYSVQMLLQVYESMESGKQCHEARWRAMMCEIGASQIMRHKAWQTCKDSASTKGTTRLEPIVRKSVIKISCLYDANILRSSNWTQQCIWTQFMCFFTRNFDQNYRLQRRFVMLELRE